MNDAQEIKKLIIGLAELYNEQLSANRLVLYAQVLSQFTVAQVQKAVNEIIHDKTVMRFPLPAIIADKIRPSENIDAEANEAANRILQAISKHGWNHATEARSFIGELGWLVVERQGGWENLCAAVMPEQHGTLKAQWRDSAKALYHRAKQGKLHEAPKLPSEMGERLGGLLRLVTEKTT